MCLVCECRSRCYPQWTVREETRPRPCLFFPMYTYLSLHDVLVLSMNVWTKDDNFLVDDICLSCNILTHELTCVCQLGNAFRKQLPMMNMVYKFLLLYLLYRGNTFSASPFLACPFPPSLLCQGSYISMCV